MIGDNIKSARRKAGLSQEELAVKLNVVRQTVSKWENGLSVPDADVLIGISQKLGVSVSDLLGIAPDNTAAENLGTELARVNELLAEKIRHENLVKRANSKRGLIIFLCFAALLISISVGSGVVSLILSGVAVLAACVILYRNLALLTCVTTEDMRLPTLRVATVFSIAVVAVCIVFAVLSATGIISVSEEQEKWLALGLVTGVMVFAGIISPRLPFTRHTGLRLPWTVQDEETWFFAHRMIGYISLPLALLYIACAITTNCFEEVSAVVLLLWIGVPSISSLIFFLRKNKLR